MPLIKYKALDGDLQVSCPIVRSRLFISDAIPRHFALALSLSYLSKICVGMMYDISLSLVRCVVIIWVVH